MDLSAEGFWRSFNTILLALPAYFLLWMHSARELAEAGDTRSTATIILLQTVVDLATWIVPLVVAALALRPLGIGNRLVPFVAVQNWFALLVTYPLALAVVADPSEGIGVFLVLGFFLATLVALVHLTRVSIGGSMPMAIGLVVLQTVIALFALPAYEALGLS